MKENKIIALGRSWKLARRRNNISLIHEEILSRVINQVEREFKRAGDNNKHAICAPLLPAFFISVITYLSAADGSTLQLVAPNEIVGFFVVVIH